MNKIEVKTLKEFISFFAHSMWSFFVHFHLFPNHRGKFSQNLFLWIRFKKRNETKTFYQCPRNIYLFNLSFFVVNQILFSVLRSYVYILLLIFFSALVVMRSMKRLSRGWYTYRTLSVSTNVCWKQVVMTKR